MSKGKESSIKVPIRFNGEDDESLCEPVTGEFATDLKTEADLGLAATEIDQEYDDASAAEVFDADNAPSLSELLQELEAQDQADAEALARAQADESGPTPVTRGERATAALAHQALSELAGLRAENAKLRNRTEKAESSKTVALDRLLRLQADFDNLRKRTERERGDIHTRLVIDVARKLLPVIDNLTRALKAEDSFQATESEEFRHFTGGVRLIYKQLNEVLEGFGVEAIPAIGQPFDPQIHEAVATEQSDEVDPDLITQELARGYRMGKRLLRPSMVKVSTR
jgi:molecular chaperone GrpE